MEAALIAAENLPEVINRNSRARKSEDRPETARRNRAGGPCQSGVVHAMNLPAKELA